MTDEPEITERVKERIEEAKAKVKELGHSVGEWKWDGIGCWRAWCQYRLCHATAWVQAEGITEPYGGTAISRKCSVGFRERR